MAPMALHDPVVPAAEAKLSALKSAAPSEPWKPIEMSSRVALIRNPIREVIAGIDLNAPPLQGGESKPLINLGLGDPSVYGNWPPPPQALDAIEASVRSGKADGYPQVSTKKEAAIRTSGNPTRLITIAPYRGSLSQSTGYAETRQAVAKYFDESETGGNWRITGDDVVMTHGASGALEMVLTVSLLLSPVSLRGSCSELFFYSVTP